MLLSDDGVLYGDLTPDSAIQRWVVPAGSCKRYRSPYFGASPDQYPPITKRLGPTSFSTSLHLLLLFPGFNGVFRLLLHFLFSNAEAELNIKKKKNNNHTALRFLSH